MSTQERIAEKLDDNLVRRAERRESTQQLRREAGAEAHRETPARSKRKNEKDDDPVPAKRGKGRD